MIRRGTRTSPADIIAPLLAAGPLAALYWWTLAPSVAVLHGNADSAELVTVASVLGVAHPPGSAIWLPLGRLAIEWFPGAEPAARTNLLSAICMTAAVAVLVLAMRRWRPEAPWWTATLGGLIAGTAPVTWSQGIVTEVLALQALLGALALWCAPAAARGRGWPLFAIVLGLLVANHPTGLALALPLGVIAAPGLPRDGRGIGTVAGLFLAPLLYSVGYLMLRADAPIAWGDTSTLSGVWTHLTGDKYRAAVDRDPQGVLRGVPETVRLFLRQVPPPLWFTMPLGAMLLARVRPAGTAALGVAAVLLTVFISGYRVVGREDYVQPIAMIGAMLAAWGVEYAWDWLTPQLTDRSARIALAVGGIGLLTVWAVIIGHDVSRRGDTSLIDNAHTLLAAVPEGGTLRTTDDRETFPLWYLTVVRGERPDVTIVDARGVAPAVGATAAVLNGATR